MDWTLFGHLEPHDGYGQIALQCGSMLKRMGAEVKLVDMRVNGVWGRAGERRWSTAGDALAVCAPDWYEFFTARRLVGLTMFESTRLPAERVRSINEFTAACIVPSSFCMDVFRACGVTVPIHLAPLGVDSQVYKFVDRSGHGGPYTFLWSGTPDMRKGWDLVYRAFWAAFGKSREARLVMHFRELPRGVTGSMDENVRLVAGSIDTGAWLDLLGEADCFVYPSRGEGWGLPPREAAATGLPVIATDWGGLHEEIYSWARPLKVRELQAAAFGDWDEGEVGDWAEPDFEHLVYLMRDCFENRERERMHGAASSSWMTVMATWRRTAKKVAEVMAEIASGMSTSPRNDNVKEA